MRDMRNMKLELKRQEDLIRRQEELIRERSLLIGDCLLGWVDLVDSLKMEGTAMDILDLERSAREKFREVLYRAEEHVYCRN